MSDRDRKKGTKEGTRAVPSPSQQPTPRPARQAAANDRLRRGAGRQER